MVPPHKSPSLLAILRKVLIGGIYGLMLLATLAWFAGGCYITVGVYPALANLRGGYDGVLPAAILTGFRDPTFFYTQMMIPLAVLRLVVGMIR